MQPRLLMLAHAPLLRMWLISYQKRTKYVTYLTSKMQSVLDEVATENGEGFRIYFHSQPSGVDADMHILNGSPNPTVVKSGDLASLVRVLYDLKSMALVSEVSRRWYEGEVGIEDVLALVGRASAFTGRRVPMHTSEGIGITFFTEAKDYYAENIAHCFPKKVLGDRAYNSSAEEFSRKNRFVRDGTAYFCEGLLYDGQGREIGIIDFDNLPVFEGALEVREAASTDILLAKEFPKYLRMITDLRIANEAAQYSWK